MQALSVLILIVAIYSTTASALAQAVVQHVTMQDYRSAIPRSVVLIDSTTYVAFDGGNVYRFDKELNPLGQVLELDDHYISEVFVADTALFANSIAGDLLVFQNSSPRWEFIGRYDCPIFVDNSDSMFALVGNVLHSIVYTQGRWTTVPRASIDFKGKRATAIALRRDTLLFSCVDDSLIYISTFDQSFFRTINAQSIVNRFWPLSDGSFAVQTALHVDRITGVGSLTDCPLISLATSDGPIGLSGVQTSRHNQLKGVVGVFDVFGSDAREGVYEIAGSTTIRRVASFDSLQTSYSVATIDDTSIILCSSTKLAVIAGEAEVVKRGWFGDTIIRVNSGIYLANNTPATTGGVVIAGKYSPALLPIANSGESLKLFGADSLPDYMASGHWSFDSGREVAFSERACYVKTPQSDWETRLSSKSAIDWYDLDYHSDSIFISRAQSRFIAVSTNKGESWDSVFINGFVTDMKRTKIAGHMLYCLSQGTLWAIELDKLHDTINPAGVSFPVSWTMMLTQATTTSISCLFGRSTIDTAINPSLFTHFSQYTWTPLTGSVDSSIVRLKKPVSSWLLHCNTRNDKTYLWSGKESRLIAIVGDDVILDSILVSAGHKTLHKLTVSASVVDSYGRWWLIDQARNVAVVLDPTPKHSTSVDEYFSYVYVGRIAPNPASTMLNVTLGRFAGAVESGLRLYIADIQGNVVKDFSHLIARFPGPVSTQDVSLDINSLSSGQYFVVVDSPQGKNIGKFVIAR